MDEKNKKTNQQSITSKSSNINNEYNTNDINNEGNSNNTSNSNNINNINNVNKNNSNLLNYQLLDPKSIRKFFPEDNNINMDKLIITDIGKYSISKPGEAQHITNLLCTTLNKLKINVKELTITDATAGFGGNLISFAKKFKHVVGIEKSNTNFHIVKNNVEIYNLKNVSLHHSSFIQEIPELCKDVVFIDPPWGGKKYRFREKIMLHLDKVFIYDIVNQIPYTTKLIAIKVPYNFDYTKFIQTIYPNQTISNWSINNYNLVIITRD